MACNWTRVKVLNPNFSVFLVYKYAVSSIQKEELCGVLQFQSMNVCTRASVCTPDISRKLTKLHFETLRTNYPMIFPIKC